MKARWTDLLQIALLLLVIGILWVHRPALNPMSITTEWETPSGRTERFTSYRESGDAFLEFNRKHDDAVADMGGPKR